MLLKLMYACTAAASKFAVFTASHVTIKLTALHSSTVFPNLLYLFLEYPLLMLSACPDNMLIKLVSTLIEGIVFVLAASFLSGITGILDLHRLHTEPLT